MTKNILEIFKNSNLELTENEEKYFFNSSILENAELSKSNDSLKVFISIQDFLPVDLIAKIENHFKNNFIYKNIKFKFCLKVNNKIYTKDLLWNYIEYIIFKKADFNKGSVEKISYSTFDFIQKENKIIFYVANDIEQQLIKNHLHYYKIKLLKYGFENLTIEVNVNEILFKNNLEQIYKENERQTKLFLEKHKQIANENSTIVKTNRNKKNNLINYNVPSYEKLSDIEENIERVVIHGQVINKICRKSKTNKNIYTIIISDNSTSIMAVYFSNDDNKPIEFDDNYDTTINEENNNESQQIKINDWVSLWGDYVYSNYNKHNVFYIKSFKKIKSKSILRKDEAEFKRVELHTHTKMSVMDGVSDVTEYINAAKNFGWKAIAITDHLNVQSFPDAYHELQKINKQAKKNDKLKLIYGSEMVLIPDEIPIIKNSYNQNLREAKFVYFDLETTGLSPEFDEIIEFGANVYDYKNNKFNKYDILIKPKKPISKFTSELTNITNAQLELKNSIEEEFPKILEIIGDGILVAHNANFDFNFLQAWAKKLNYPPLTNTVIDTLALARLLQPKLKNHKLGTVAKAYFIFYDDKIAHRADYDAEILTNVYEHMWHEAKKIHSINYVDDWNKFNINKYENENFKRTKGYHVNVLAKNQEGLKDLYKLISYSHTTNFLKSPKIFKSKLLEVKSKNNILLGCGCLNGLVFEYARTGTFEMLEEAIEMFDYIEIQPLSVYKKFIQTGDLTEQQLKEIILKIIQISKNKNKIIVATSDAHYVDPHLKIIRDIYINTKGIGGEYHPLYDFKQRVKDNPDQHLRTTLEMLKEFEWLDDPKFVKEIVIDNSNYIANLIEENISPIKAGSYPPNIKDVDKKLTKECYKNAQNLYGEQLPLIVKERLEKELAAIIKHGFAVVYWISHLLVKKSNEDGYLVGSRGSVGSSFVATTSLITEVNPLKAHYRCLNCKYSDFDTPEQYKCGYDLPEKNCVKCNHKLIGDGHDIPFETFLGFDGDKVPDIDLNFSGDYQPIAHNFTKEIFGEENVFRAGTISTVADKTAYGFTMGYFEKQKVNINDINKVEVDRLAKLATGVKRTTGQHPGGIIILPKEYEIEDFTPINYPADDNDSEWKTTHFDFQSIHDNLLKMDILGHVDPTALRMLHDLTGFDPIKIPTNDKKVYSLFSNLSALNIDSSSIMGETTGAIGLPEFGTNFVRNMLEETQPKTFADLVQISGLSHGTNVYLGNAQQLIRDKVANISSVIGCRDDIMVYLMSKNLDSSIAFNIMESVRKGKGLTNEWIEIMKNHNIPDWYINSCLKIKYMFPKAHATAYVLMAYRVAWYKIYYPEEYYAVWFSTRADFFDLPSALEGPDKIKELAEDIRYRLNNKLTVSAKEASLLVTYEVLLEMFARNIKIKNIDFNISQANKFILVQEDNEKVLVPPFTVIDSLGEAVANSIIKARSERQITSVKDLKQRTQVTQTQIETFTKLKIIDDLKDDEQLSFDF